ncbi:MAG: hypothetical protein ACM3SY_05200 [Candidatus Omnitrophota bacterium]
MNPSQSINPFKGLYSYEEKDKDIFYGRIVESEELANLVELNRITVIFGKSGIGKTSLLNAGLFPLIREKGFLPIRIRLDYTEEGLPLISQIKQTIQRELERHEILEMKKGEDAPADPIRDDESLWEYFRRVDHLNKRFSEERRGGSFEKNSPSFLTPLLVFDQFEEFFTIGKHHPQRELLVEELYWLVEDQMPPQLRQRLLNSRETFPYLRGDSSFRIILGLREDYLPHLNELKQRIPSLLKVLFRVTQVNGIQAREILDRSGAFPDEKIKKDIIDQFYPADIGPGKLSDDKLEIEPALFSLLCSQVYEKGMEALTRQTKDNILTAFYDEILGQLPRKEELEEWIESHLLTEGGFRTPFYLEREHGMREVIEAAVDKKLLRKLYMGEKEYVEIIHDILASVINERRKRRIGEKKRLEMEKELRRKRRITAIISMVASAAIILAIFLFIQKNRADKQYKIATSMQLASEAEIIVPKDHFKAIRMAEAAYKIDQSATTARSLCSTVYSILMYPIYIYSLEHSSNVYSASFSPDGSRILTVSGDGTAKLWNFNGPLKVTLMGHNAQVDGADFSPDGSRILTIYKKTAKLWDLEWKLLATFNHADNITSAIFSSDGSRVLTASKDKTAKLWDTKGKHLVTLKGHTKKITNVASSPDGSRILTASDDMTAKIWDLKGNSLASMNHKAGITIVAFSPDGSRILTASNDGTAKLWNSKGKMQIIMEGKASITMAIFSPDGSRILTGSYDGNLRLWDLKGNKQAEMTEHTRKITSAVFSKDGYRILTASWDNTAKLWDINGNLLKDMNRHSGELNSAVFHPKNPLIVLTASFDKTAKIWNLRDDPLVMLKGHTQGVSTAFFSPDGTRILTASGDKTAKLWDREGKLLVTFKGHEGQVNSAVFSADGKRILTASVDKTAKLWEITGESLVTFIGHKGPVNSAVFSPDGKQILTASADKTAKLWYIDGKLISPPLKGHKDSIFTADFSPNGAFIFTSSFDETTRIWNTKIQILQGFNAAFSPESTKILTSSEEGIARLWGLTEKGKWERLTEMKHTSVVTHAIFSRDGSRILTTSCDKTAKLWDLKGNRLSDFIGHTSEVVTPSFSPDDSKVLTASYDNTAKLWDLKGNLLADLKGHRDKVPNAAFSPDGKWIVTASVDGTAIVWPTFEVILNWLKTAPIPQLTEQEKKELGIDKLLK